VLAVDSGVVVASAGVGFSLVGFAEGVECGSVGAFVGFGTSVLHLQKPVERHQLGFLAQLSMHHASGTLEVSVLT